MDIGLAGIGNMGSLVVSALLTASHRVVVFDVNPDALERSRALGATTADTPQDLAKNCEIILLLLPGPSQVEAVVLGEEGLLSGSRPGQVIIDMSTVGPNTSRKIDEHARKLGVDFLDAPILGRPSSFGRWLLPVGGDEAVFIRCQPLLKDIAKEVVRVGPVGTGHTLKLLNALLFSAINAMTVEMMAISVKVGLSPSILYNTIIASGAATVSGLFKEVGAKIINQDFSPTFSIDLMCKDNGLAIAMAREFDAPPILANAIQVLNELARSRGLGTEDTSALVKVYESILEFSLEDDPKVTKV